MINHVNNVNSLIERIPTRPLHLQGDKFKANFDKETLFYDCFRLSDHEIMIIAPALFNLKSLLLQSHFSSEDKILKFTLEEFKLLSRIRINADLEVKKITLSGEIGNYTFEINNNQNEDFKNLRVITTVQKDNDPIWIEDWIKFYRDIHGCEAVLIYDNGSTTYSLAALEKTLAAILGLKAWKIVSWPFIYGPGPPPTIARTKKYWDSNFCQPAALEHARHCYLRDARSVNFTDIDELILPFGKETIFEATENSLLGITMTAGRWVIATQKHESTPRHRDFTTLLKKKSILKKGFIPSDGNACKTKWSIVPSKLPNFACLNVHNIINWPFSYLPTRKFSFRHFRNINLNWFDDRLKIESFDENYHEIDHDLIKTFTRIKE